MDEKTVLEQPQKGSELPTKFKSSEQLAQAYESLEAEFTRKCQALRELAAEKARLEEELRREQEQKADVEKVNEADEKDPQPASDKPWSEIVEEFLNKYPSAVSFSAELAHMLAQRPESKTEQGLEHLYLQLVAQKFKPYEQLVEDEEFLNEYVLGNQKINDMIITRYLQALAGKESPKLMGQGGGYMPIAKRRSAKTLEEAGAFTLETLK